MDEMTDYEKLGHRVAEEAQLLAEEKWIIEALEKVRQQRNCLQIERLQLESMKKQLKTSTDKSVVVKSQESKQDRVPVTFNLEMMSKVPSIESTDASTAQEHLLETEALCNKEALNLNVTNSVLGQIPFEDLNTEEDEDEYEDEENCEDLVIDMNMFMHGSQTNKSDRS